MLSLDVIESRAEAQSTMVAGPRPAPSTTTIKNKVLFGCSGMWYLRMWCLMIIVL